MGTSIGTTMGGREGAGFVVLLMDGPKWIMSAKVDYSFWRKESILIDDFLIFSVAHAMD